MNFSGKTVVVASVWLDRGGERTREHASYGVHVGAASDITGIVLPVDGGRTGITPGTRPPQSSAAGGPHHQETP